MSKKLFAILSMLILFAAAVCALDGCSGDKGKQASVYSGEDLFLELISSDIQRIVYYSFDEEECCFDSAEDIEDIIKALKSCSYRELPEDEYVEGLYSISIERDNGSFECGISDSTIAYEGVQYEIYSGSLKDLISLLQK
ncbi:hypothetical protein [Butyrivibrio sp. MC2013]|uniref:hypothetical protein n=1 Tax=Butyrivibrio sp. MC2013 TaxID=1280686 RepID=UPI0003FBE86B|nr:hypothetical protein [Butyrivibrio sp. MC2013]